MSAALEVRNLAFAYARKAGHEALRGISFEVERASHTGIVGPNGAGKSTLLKLLAGFLLPGSGDVLYDGKPLASWKKLALARRVAYVPQTAQADVAFTALEVALAGRFPHVGYLGVEGPRDEAIARAALERVDAGALAERRFCELSGGEQARVLVARALAQEPDLLLLDEPTAFLDLGHRLDLYDRLREENRSSGLTVLVVTHDLNMAAEYCDRVLLLSEGAIAAQGAPEEVLTPDRLSSLYGCPVAVDRNPATGAVRVTPLPRHASGSGAAEPDVALHKKP